MTRGQLCSEDDIKQMVQTFYARVRTDAVLGPVFNAHIDDWDAHLKLLEDFWSSLLRGTGRFFGAPMPKHIALPGLDAAMFRHWLALFDETLRTHPNQAMAEEAISMATRIANRLWLGYQMGNYPDKTATPLKTAAS